MPKDSCFTFQVEIKDKFELPRFEIHINLGSHGQGVEDHGDAGFLFRDWVHMTKLDSPLVFTHAPMR